jgi:hypothetical protein
MRIFHLSKYLGQNGANHKSGKHSHLQNIGNNQILRQGIATARYGQKSIFYQEARSTSWLKEGEQRDIHFPLRRLAHQRGKPRNLYASLTGSSENTWQKPRYISGWLKAYNTIANPRTSFLNEKKQKQNTNSSSTPLGSTKLLYFSPPNCLLPHTYHLIVSCAIKDTPKCTLAAQKLK